MPLTFRVKLVHFIRFLTFIQFLFKYEQLLGGTVFLKKKIGAFQMIHLMTIIAVTIIAV